MPRNKQKKRKTSPDIFGAASAPLRFQILKLLHVHNSLGYSEIMSQMGLNPGRDAGKFAYHLRTLLKAGLSEVDKDSKKYRLTALGNTMIGFSQEVEEHILREEGKLLVRTSRFAMEEFDREKIAQALNREAGIPLDLAKRIAEETEERLLKLDSLHLTAPLIREFVNAILVEKGLQEYRRKHTRLGLPVYDVTTLFENSEAVSTNVEDIRYLTGKSVMRDYVFLNVLPRKVADAHLSGNIHVNKAESWIIKPDEVQHDLRVFLKNGFNFNQDNSLMMTIDPPKTFEAALTLTEAMIHASRTEVVNEQGVCHFNVFLAPFVKGMFLEDLRRILKQFVFSVSYLSNGRRGFPAVSLGLDFTIPPHLQNVKVIGENGKSLGVYDDYFEESLKILVALLDVLFEDDVHRPILNPRLALNLSEETLNSKEVETPLVKAHELAAKWGIPHFINSSLKEQEKASYFVNGNRLASDWTGDWELDTLRTGSLGTIAVNLPRLALEFPGDDRKFLRGLSNYLKISVTALKGKNKAIKKRLNQALLPLLSQEIANESYLRLENTPFNISVVGLNEATKIQTDKQLYEDARAVDYAAKILGHMALEAKKLSWKSGFRIGLSQSVNNEASTRFAELDVKKHGWKNVFTQGNENSPYYTATGVVPLEADISLEDRLRIDGSFHKHLNGGHLSLIELEEPERSPEALLKISRHICQTSIGAFAYTRSYGYCLNCKKSFGGLQKKCPECKTVKNFLGYSRLSSYYLPVKHWPPAQQTRRAQRKKYII
ncbi:MAG: anaerobic ribonucleoside-triphosphate reductase [Candidatus Bathyarchaeia archaeon]